MGVFAGERVDTKEQFRHALECEISSFLRDRTELGRIPYYWRNPIVGFADADISSLREIVSADHYLAEEVLPGARTIISYFLPFRNEVGDGNVQGNGPSDEWVDSYLITNDAAVLLNRHLCEEFKRMGSKAAVPEHAGITRDLKSRWSQRHIARSAGLGTFGLNNMLITEAGCCGRFFSVVTDIHIEPDNPVEREFCLFKRNGSCGICAKKCIPRALRTDGFDRSECHRWMTTVPKRDHGLDVCGKCVSGLPCSYGRP